MKKLNEKGFTLMELIVVIAIIAVLMLILVPTMGGFVNQAKQEANVANAKAVYTAVMAQNTAASSGLKDKNNNAYSNITVPSGSESTGIECKATETVDGSTFYKLNDDFYDVTEINDACKIKVDTNGLFVEYGTGTTSGRYPN